MSDAPAGATIGLMLFGSTSLAARIERAACRLITDSVAAITRRRPEADVVVLPISGGVAAYTDPGSPLNKVAGLGLDGPLDEARLAEVESAFDRRRVPVQVELANLADPSIGAVLGKRGYLLRGFENVLGRALPVAASAPPPPGVAVAIGNERDFGLWMDVVNTGFATADTQGVPSHESFDRELIERIVADMATTQGFVRYLATLDGQPAGGASMRVGDGVCMLCGAATLPALRRRGVQSALLAARLADASRLGCDVATITTQPGSKSQENAQRQGFTLLYTRAMLVREA